ncbi:MAG TPA: UDP-N-acetylmuramoyl-L-alanyl-D-glutamate--2,6-diaminopimelate ligase [Acidobacteriaceae bacterium]|jgi:UDP-N-acetylmuramoyl-L-alanyl-D-glutamate--2,6-diaminopimelate ligase
MRWSDVAANMTSLEVSGPETLDIRGVHYDSRRIAAGDVFVAMRGGTTDGNRFVEAALRNGAAAVVTDSAAIFDELKAKYPDRALALVEHGRRALAEVSSTVFGKPQEKLKLTAVTGTNGKTTTAFLVEQMLRWAGRRSVLLGTIETHVGDLVRESEHTTPESRDILALFAEGVQAGCTEAVMEMSSHALHQERVWGLPVDVAIFTNLTQDHLDYHGTMDAYARAKARLFAGVGAPPPRVAVVNLDSEYGAAMGEEASLHGAVLMTYAIGGVSAGASGAAYRAENVSLGLGDTRFRFVTPQGSVDVHSPLSGRVNVENLLAAMCAALARGLTLEQVVSSTEQLRQVPGRFQIVSGSREAGVTVVVDYAHTDDALRNLIALAREQADTHGGRVITMFGCGGDRDRTKRPKMGRAAGEGSDLVVVTSDNPRSEDPMAIIEASLVGVRSAGKPYIVETDRHKAIARAVYEATRGDIVLLAGKGHEKTQVFADGAVPFDDVAEAEQVLREMKVG